MTTEVRRHRFDGRTYLELGRTDAPTVLLLHEITGIDDHLMRWAHRLAERFRVLVPALLDPDGRPGALPTMRALCISREIHVLATGRTSPIVGWLRRLAEHDVRGRYGVIGMCLSGGFALGVAVDERVPAAVVAQPSLPASVRWLPGDARRRADLGLDPADAEALRHRADLQVRAFRFRDDAISPGERLGTACALLGDRIRAEELPGASRRHHSTLTTDQADPTAVAAVLDFLTERLTPPPVEV